MDKIKSVAQRLYGVWDSLPSAVKILVYVLLGGMLQQLTLDISNVDVNSLGVYAPYANLALLGLHDALVYYAERFVAKAANLKQDD